MMGEGKINKRGRAGCPRSCSIARGYQRHCQGVVRGAPGAVQQQHPRERRVAVRRRAALAPRGHATEVQICRAAAVPRGRAAAALRGRAAAQCMGHAGAPRGRAAALLRGAAPWGRWALTEIANHRGSRPAACRRELWRRRSYSITASAARPDHPCVQTPHSLTQGQGQTPSLTRLPLYITG